MSANVRRGEGQGNTCGIPTTKSDASKVPAKRPVVDRDRGCRWGGIFVRIVKTSNRRYYDLAIDQGDIGCVDSVVWANQLTAALAEGKREINIQIKVENKVLILIGLYHALDRHLLCNGNAEGCAAAGRDRMKPYVGAGGRKGEFGLVLAIRSNLIYVVFDWSKCLPPSRTRHTLPGHLRRATQPTPHQQNLRRLFAGNPPAFHSRSLWIHCTEALR